MRPCHEVSWSKTLRTPRRRWWLCRPQLEQLEPRQLMSATPTPPATYYETIDQADNLSILSPGTPLLETGNIGNGPAGAADVNFYQFTLTQSASVTLNAQDVLSSDTAGFVISLYNADQQDPMGNRLIAQNDGATNGGDANITINLSPGTYYAGISGSGNLYYYPYLADSGYDGNTGNYQLSLAATTIPSNPGDGPTVVRFDPNQSTYLPAGPLVLRAALSAPIDPTTIQVNTNVELFYDPTDPFTSSSGTQLTLASVNYDPSALEIQAAPSAPLAPGYYRFTLLGNSDTWGQGNVIETADATPIPLGEINGVNDGQDYSTTFYVAGILGNVSANPTADDTLATAHELGNVTNAGLVQTQGVIGDNPNDPTPFNPASVDFYHFEITGTGNYAFGAEVFANRIDSQLGAAIQLYQMEPNGTLVELANNQGSMNATIADNAQVPLFSDPVVYASLSAGNYYVAVTSQFTTYDPQTTLSANGGFTSGPYVLNLRVDPATTPPQVLTTSITSDATLTTLPTTFTVQFSEPMNLQQLAFQAYIDTSVGIIPSVTIQGSDGSVYYPRLQSYDPTTDTATFLLIDALPNGSYTLDLSGPNGLDDLGGNPLVGNDPASGDYLVPFTIAAPPRGTPGDSTTWLAQEPNDDPDNPQQLGTLFPVELSNTVTISHPSSTGPTDLTDTADYYEISVLETQNYLFTLTNLTNLPEDVTPTIWADGVQEATIPQGSNAVFVSLNPGTYVIGVDWSSQPATDVGYDLQISMLGSLEPATSLTTGPAPALQLRLATNSSPPTSTPPSTGSSGSSPGPTSTPPGTTNTPPNNPPQSNPSNPTTPPAQNPPPAAGNEPTSNNSPPPNGNTAGNGPPQVSPTDSNSSTGAVVPASLTTSASTPTKTAAVAAGPPAEAAPGVNANLSAATVNATGPANVVIPSNVVLALTDRAFGSADGPNTATTVFLREASSNTATAMTGDSGPLALSTQASLSANVLASGGDLQNLQPPGPLLPDSPVMRVPSGVDIAQWENKLLQAALAAAREVPYYSEEVAKLFASWQFGYQPANPPHGSSAQGPAGSVLPPLSPVVEEPLAATLVSIPVGSQVPWYHPSNLKSFTIVVLSLTLAALRLQNWRSNRAGTKVTASLGLTSLSSSAEN